MLVRVLGRPPQSNRSFHQHSLQFVASPKVGRSADFRPVLLCGDDARTRVAPLIFELLYRQQSATRPMSAWLMNGHCHELCPQARVRDLNTSSNVSCVVVTSARCPLCPRKRTFSRALGLSAKADQVQSSKVAPLFDHLVGGNEQRARHSQAKNGGCLLVDLKLELDRLLDGQITRIGAFQDTISV